MVKTINFTCDVLTAVKYFLLRVSRVKFCYVMLISFLGEANMGVGEQTQCVSMHIVTLYFS